MKFKHFFISLLLLLVAITAGAQMPTQTIPADTAFRVGRLSNGLTYYKGITTGLKIVPTFILRKK